MGLNLHLLKSNFGSGEIDPEFDLRTEISHHASGASLLENVLVKPQAGVIRRPGLEFIADLTDDIAADDEVRLVRFEFSSDDTFLLVFLDEEIKVVKNGAIVHTITSVPYTAAQVREINFTQSYDTLIVFHRSVKPQVITRVTDTNWTIADAPFVYIPKYDYSPATSTPAGTVEPSGTTGLITITGVGTNFTSAYVGQKLSFNGGLVRVTQFISTTSIKGAVEIPITDTDVISSGSWTLRSGFEDAWSTSRGWPTCGTFHGGRLYMAGGPRPATVYGSRIGEFYDHEPLDGLDDEPVEVTLDSDGLNEVVNMLSLRDLLIFTTGGEFVETNKPITPNNFAPLQNTRRGSKPSSNVLELEGAALFVQRKGKAIREFYFTDTEGSYVAENLTLISSHLINDPVDFVKRPATSTSESDLLVLVNADGTCRVCSIVRSQSVVAWSRVTTPNGSFVACGIDDDEVYFIVKRTVDSGTVYFLERFNSDHVLDSSVRVSLMSATTSVAAAHLPSEGVTVYANDADAGDITLDASGDGTLLSSVETYYEVGYNPVPRIKPMPIEQTLQDGTTAMKKKRVSEVILELADTTYVEVNGNQLSFRKFGSAALDQPPPKFTGRAGVSGLLGYKLKNLIEITQTRPGTLNIRGMAAKVTF